MTQAHVAPHSMPVGYDIQPYDVINGRGKKSAQNVGNRRFNTTIAIFRSKYSEAVNRKEKSFIIQTIIRCVRESGGHFLKKDHERWVEIGDDAAYEKVSHALRDMTLSLKANFKIPRPYPMGHQMQLQQQHHSFLPATSTPPPPHQMTMYLPQQQSVGASKLATTSVAKQSRPVSPSESSSQSLQPEIRLSKSKRKTAIMAAAADVGSKAVNDAARINTSPSAKHVSSSKKYTSVPNEVPSLNMMHQENTMKRLQLDAAELLLNLSKSDSPLVQP